jgi:hypothetical protein
VDLEAFELVVLRRPSDATGYDDATLDRIQAEHLAYLSSLREAGHVVTNGPVLDQPDESVRVSRSFASRRWRRPGGSRRRIPPCAPGGLSST